MNTDQLNQTTRKEILDWDGKDLTWLARFVVDKPEHDMQENRYCKNCGTNESYFSKIPCNKVPLTQIYPNLSDENILRIIAWELLDKIVETGLHEKWRRKVPWELHSEGWSKSVPRKWIRAALLCLKENTE